MNNIMPALYMLAFAACGFPLADVFFKKDRLTERVFFALAIGLVMLIWLPTLAAFLLGFTLAAQLVALAAAVIAAAAAILIKAKRSKASPAPAQAGERVKTDRRALTALLLTVIPLVSICWILHLNHTIVPASNGSLHVGQCTYGDLCMHLGFISSISVQKTFPPEYSLLPGTPLGYPFLCDSVSSTFYTLGASLRAAAILPALYASLVVVLGVYVFFNGWFKRTSTAVIGTYLFFIGGGFGFAYILNNRTILLEQGVDRVKNMLEGFYQAPTNIPAEGLRWVNTIADMILPQRATLFGWAILFPALRLLYRAAIEKQRRLFPLLGVLAGALPLVHTHSFLALGLISIWLFTAACLDRLRLRFPGENGALGARLIALFVPLAALGVLRMLPLAETLSGIAGLISSCAALALGLAAAAVSVVELLRRTSKKTGRAELALSVLALVLSFTVCVGAYHGNRIGSALAVIAPLIGIAVAFFIACADVKLEKDTDALSESRRFLAGFAIFGVIAVLLASPQLFGFTFKQSADSASFMRWSFNWDNESDSYLWFYIKNLGLIFILMPIAFAVLKREHRRFYCGALLIFAVSEMLLFQPNPYDNNKLLFVWFLFTCGIVAELLASRLASRAYLDEDGERKRLDVGRTAARLMLLGFALAAMLLSGAMTLHREYVSADHYGFEADADGVKRLQKIESGYEVVSAPLVKLTDWVKQNTPADAVFLTANNHNNAIAMLTGRSIFCGSGTFLHWHGVDYRPRADLIPSMYSDPQSCLRTYAEEYGIDYVLIGRDERSNHQVNVDWFDENLECVYSFSGVKLYRIG